MPLAIAALGLTVGTGLTIAGNKKSQDAIAAARGTYAGEQDALSRKNNAIAAKSIASSSPDVAGQEMKAGQDARMSVWDNLQKSTVPIASALPATGTSGQTAKAQARTGGAANTWNKLNATAAAREGSYGDWQTAQTIKNADSAQSIGINNDAASGNARIYPTELEVAGQAGDKLSGWGNIVSTLGSLAGMASAATAPAAAAKSGVTGTQIGSLNAGNGPVNAATAVAQRTAAGGGGMWNSIYGSGVNSFTKI